MKIVFFNRFFFPDTSATSQILSDLAFHLAGEGRPTEVVTTYASGTPPRTEDIRGVRVHRVAEAMSGPHSLYERVLAYARYYKGAREAVRHIVEAGDIVVLKTDPPLLSVAIGPLAKARGAKVIAWLQDVFPEIAREYGIPGMGGAIGWIFRRARDRSLASADAVVAISDRMALAVRDLADLAKKPHVIHNWADGTAIVPVDVNNNPLRRQWNLDKKFVVAYSGNLGRVHEFDTLLGAASQLRDDDRVRFLIVGRGPRLAEVARTIWRDELANVHLQPHQDRRSLATSLGAADVHVSVLRPEFEGLVMPSKLYGILAAGRPTIFIGDPGGETARILADTGSGISIPYGDAAGLAAAIRQLRDNPGMLSEMGIRARAAFDERFAMQKAFSQWRALLDSLE
jgi:colanic acid biosynthesis glycosyl transferase WcaI